MRILADIHISLATVSFLRGLGHDVIRVQEVLSASCSDDSIVAAAAGQDRVVLTQDLDFSAIIALSHRNGPSLISLRLGSSRVEHVNGIPKRVLPLIEADLLQGAIVAVTEERIRRRPLPLT